MMKTISKSGGILVTGAGGFIGGHVVAALRSAGFSHVRAIDIDRSTSGISRTRRRKTFNWTYGRPRPVGWLLAT